MISKDGEKTFATIVAKGSYGSRLDKWPENVLSQDARVKIIYDVRTAAMWAAANLDKWPEGYTNKLLGYDISYPVRAAAMWADTV